MDSRILTISALVMMMAATACQHDLDFAIPDDTIGFRNTELIDEVSIFDESYTLSVIKSGKQKSAAIVQLSVCSAAEVEAYRQSDSTFSSTIADAGSYSFPSDAQMSFEASDVRKTAQITWDASQFYKANGDKDVVIPVKIAESSIGTDSTRTMVFIKPYVSSISFTGEDIKNLYPTAENTLPTDVFQGKGQISIDKAVSSRDITITLGIDNSKIAEASAARGKDYVQAPDGLITLDETTITLKAGELYADFSYTINEAVLFNAKGKFKYNDVAFMAPVTITATDPVEIGRGEVTVGYIIVKIADSDTVEPPIGVDQKDIIGPWEVLDGSQYDMAHDPNKESSWYDTYNVTKLVDGNFHYYDGAMGVWFWTQNEFPLSFVFDLGQTYIFGGFRLVDSKTHQNQFRHIQVYTAKEYVGDDTDWKLACEGTRAYDKGWQAWPSDEGSQASLDPNFTYHMPEDSSPDLTNSFTYTKGRYIKLVLVEPNQTTGDYANGRGYLMEFYATGWDY